MLRVPLQVLDYKSIVAAVAVRGNDVVDYRIGLAGDFYVQACFSLRAGPVAFGYGNATGASCVPVHFNAAASLPFYYGAAAYLPLKPVTRHRVFYRINQLFGIRMHLQRT